MNKTTPTAEFSKELDNRLKCLNYLKLNDYDISKVLYAEYKVLLDLCIEVFLDKSTKQESY